MTVGAPASLASAIKRAAGTPRSSETHWGTVLSVTAGVPTVTVNGGSVGIPVQPLASYVPAVGDTCLLMLLGSDDRARSTWIALGTVSGGGNARTFLASSESTANAMAAVTAGYQATATTGAWASGPFTLTATGILVAVSGYAQVNAQLEVAVASGTNVWAEAAIYVGGTLIANGSRGNVNSTYDASASVSDIVPVTAGQTIQLGARSTISTTTQPGPTVSYLSVSMLP